MSPARANERVAAPRVLPTMRQALKAALPICQRSGSALKIKVSGIRIGKGYIDILKALGILSRQWRHVTVGGNERWTIFTDDKDRVRH